MGIHTTTSLIPWHQIITNIQSRIRSLYQIIENPNIWREREEKKLPRNRTWVRLDGHLPRSRQKLVYLWPWKAPTSSSGAIRALVSCSRIFPGVTGDRTNATITIQMFIITGSIRGHHSGNHQYTIMALLLPIIITIIKHIRGFKMSHWKIFGGNTTKSIFASGETCGSPCQDGGAVADMQASAEGIQMSRVTRGGGVDHRSSPEQSQTDGRYLISGLRPFKILGEPQRKTHSLIPSVDVHHTRVRWLFLF